jgi:putative DNA primase/helicase
MNLEAYAEKTALPLDFLREIGITEAKFKGVPCCIIPYWDLDGKLQRYRVRNNARRWWNDDFDGELPIIPYGLWRLSDTDPVLYLTEGESDAQTLWHHGFNALGIPGALLFKTEWTRYLLGYDQLIICPDADAAGQSFAESIIQKVGEYRLEGEWVHRFEGSISVLNLPPGIKDINDLLKASTNAE